MPRPEVRFQNFRPIFHSPQRRLGPRRILNLPRKNKINSRIRAGSRALKFNRCERRKIKNFPFFRNSLFFKEIKFPRRGGPGLKCCIAAIIFWLPKELNLWSKTVNNLADFTKSVAGMAGIFPADLNAFNKTVRSTADFGEKMSKVTIEAAEKTSTSRPNGPGKP